MDDVDVLAVPRLAKGSHHRNSGKMCAMNLVSWERGDWLITDYPANVAAALARFCQHLNDRVCIHSAAEPNLLCPACSMGVIDVAHATVGTGGASAELSWRWAAAVADLAADELHQVSPWGAATVGLRNTAGSCRDIARRITEMAGFAIRSDAEGPAAGTSASSALGMMMMRTDPVRAIRFAARAVALWHEMAASTPVVADPAVVAAAWAAATQEAEQHGVVTFMAQPVVPAPVWLSTVQSTSSFVLTI